MNLAIVIGISEYDNAHDLPSCKNDAEYIKDLLKSSDKYDDILYFEGKKGSNDIMDIMDNFIIKYTGMKINEFILYFSGHGYYNEDDFYFCTSNVDLSQINSTSISNTNVDKLIKKLQPETYVKIIDACESGNSYIKDIGNKEKIFEKNYDGFKNCYFFSSSECTQGSYANEYISDFTKEFLEIIKKYILKDKIKDIKYRQISAALSDAFATNTKQTPFFVSQGTLAEVFISYNNKIEEFLKNMELNSKRKEEYNEKVDGKIEEVSKIIPSKEEAINSKNTLINKISKRMEDQNSNLLNDYDYKFYVENIGSNDVMNKVKIGNWLEENKNKFYIFAKEKYSKKTQTNKLTNIAAILSQEPEYEVSGFKLNVDENDSIYQLELISENHLPKYCCQLIIMYSLTKIYLLYDFSYSYPKNWEEYTEYSVSDKVNIASVIIKEKDIINDVSKKICNEFQIHCDEHLKKYLDVLFEK